MKGESVYERIAKSDARAGDYVKFIETDDEGTTIGKMYEIEAIDCDGDPVFTDDIDQETYATLYDTYEVYRKPGAAVPKPERLNVGDYAKVVKDSHDHEVEIGTILLVTIIDDAAPSIKCDDISGNRIGWFFGHELVRATDEEVAEAKDAAARAKFKRGDKVRLKSGGEKFPLSGFSDGGVYTVMYNDFNHSHGKRIRIADGTEGFGYATPDQLEILSEEEAAEHKKWAEIGREVGEYKVGDIFRNPDGILYEVTRIDDRSTFSIRFTDLEGDDDGYTRKANLTLVTPVEARFDR
ncbi:hypothetical protein ACFTXL_01120 [Bacillus subtilis]